MKLIILIISILIIGCSPATKKQTFREKLDNCETKPFIITDVDGNKNAAYDAMKKLAWEDKADYIHVMKKIPPHYMKGGFYNPGYTLNGFFYYCD